MIITFSGDPGSGKSTLAKRLAEELGMPRYYVGQIWRDLARDAGMSVAEFNHHNEGNPANDRKVDDYQKNLGETEDHFVIEGRTSWFLIPQSIKIYVSVEPMEGAKRIFGALQNKNNRNEGKGAQTVEDIMQLNAERTKSDDLRYRKFYSPTPDGAGKNECKLQTR